MTGPNPPAPPVDLDLARSPDLSRRLAGRAAIVTGAGAEGPLLGTGGAMAVLFASQGAQVGLVDVSAERAANTAALIDKVGGTAAVVVADITAGDECERSVREVVDRFGRLDILVNNAALAGGGGDPAALDQPAWDRTMALNLTAVMLMTRQCGPPPARRRRRVDHQHVLDRRDAGDGRRGVRGEQGRGDWPHVRERPRSGPRRHPGELHRPRPPIHADGQPGR